MIYVMSRDSQDKLREARELFEQSTKTFYDAHEKGMESLAELTGQEQAESLGAAIEQERRAFEQMGEAIDLQRKALEERGVSPDES
jgi:hypothetical protein